jgi:hypothetical protein
LPGGKDKAVAIETVSCRDISVTGAAIMTKREYELEEMFLLEMYLGSAPSNMGVRFAPERAPPLYVTASVKRCIPWRGSKMFNTGVLFVGLTKNMSEAIAKFVLTEQQRQIKKKRLL